MANPWLRETFVIPGVAGQAARTINMIKIDDTLKGQLLALLKGSTTDQGPNPMPAIGLMGHTQGDVDFPINSINVGDQDNPNHVSFDDHTVRTLHAKALCQALDRKTFISNFFPPPKKREINANNW